MITFVENINLCIYYAATASGSFYVDAFTPFNFEDKSVLYIADGVHPSALGQVFLYEAACDVLDEAGLLYSKHCCTRKKFDNKAVCIIKVLSILIALRLFKLL